MGHAVLAEGLRKSFDKKAALDGFDLAVPAGTVCGLLGPNGAGKTTAVRILATLLRLDGGHAARPRPRADARVLPSPPAVADPEALTRRVAAGENAPGRDSLRPIPPRPLGPRNPEGGEATSGFSGSPLEQGLPDVTDVRAPAPAGAIYSWGRFGRGAKPPSEFFS